MNITSYLRSTAIMGLWNISFLWSFNPLTDVAISIPGEWSKKIDQSCPEPCRRKGRDLLIASRRGQQLFGARSVLPVREHGKMTTCLREALRRRQGTPLAAFFNISKIQQIFKGTV